MCNCAMQVLLVYVCVGARIGRLCLRVHRLAGEGGDLFMLLLCCNWAPKAKRLAALVLAARGTCSVLPSGVRSFCTLKADCASGAPAQNTAIAPGACTRGLLVGEEVTGPCSRCQASSVLQR